MLRPYQEAAIEQIRGHYMKGTKKVLLHLATGGGKTVIFSYIMKKMAEAGKRPVMVVRGRQLVDQASERLRREGVSHGVMMAGHWNYQPTFPVQICSIDTLRARDIAPQADLIVIDEAHMALSPSYVKFLAQYDDPFILAVTATPFMEKSMRHMADVIVKPVTVEELISQGFLVGPRNFAPSTPDLSGVEISQATKDYKQDQLSTVMSQSFLVGDIITHWKNIVKDRPTICFAVSVVHSKNIVQQFLASGIPAEHCDADTPDAERYEILKRLESGETKVVCNVGILCTGVDMPYVGAIIMARPTKSYNLYIQQAGRGTRPFHEKSDFILLDHAGNLLRHGFITTDRNANLDGTKEKSGPRVKQCKQCFAVYEGSRCPEGCEPPAEDGGEDKQRKILKLEGVLTELHALPTEAQISHDIEHLKRIRDMRGYKKSWVYYQIRDKWGIEVAARKFPGLHQWLTNRMHTHGSSTRS